MFAQQKMRNEHFSDVHFLLHIKTIVKRACNHKNGSLMQMTKSEFRKNFQTDNKAPM